ncbi:trimeric intracellular cation channel family protein [Starkeya koreensis]|uniref:Trimeric intracellular cation channel family protein n=1 Tax=Ancylobacter koreensis TaxID=266121 RepID=A0ABT0DQB3_9HYPH|nr:trimeric intracellular cation channel family protein [Ancylobacter koreensis]MCK0209470.1 trimeric intracellular cation channel family protein [Ancylobacter koreensis]
MEARAGGLVLALNLVGTAVFALSGGLAGVRRGMDLFGVLVLALVTAAAGGGVRDVLIGAIPPAFVAGWHALALALAAGLFAFRFPDLLERVKAPELLLDAAGLGVFAATGTEKALAFGVSPLMAAILGMVTGIGGGMVRDVLTGRPPEVLYADIYAVAALAGAVLVAGGHQFGIRAAMTLRPGAALCSFLRMMAIHRGWKLPMARRAGSTRANSSSRRLKGLARLAHSSPSVNLH